MCECEKRINDLKNVLSQFMGHFHDVIADQTDESAEWDKIFFDEITEFQNKVEAI